MNAIKKTTAKETVGAAEAKPSAVKKVIQKGVEKTVVPKTKTALPREEKTVIVKEKVQTATGWKRAMLAEKKETSQKKKG